MMKSHRLLALGTAVVVGCVAVAVSAQAPASPAFDVASIKPNKSGDPVATFGIQGGGRVIAANFPVGGLISMAFRTPAGVLRRSQIVGGPDWLNIDRFDIEAKPPSSLGPGIRLDAPEIAEMLRTLLTERFKLAVHHEMRETSVFDLVLARSDRRLGSQIRQVQVDCAAMRAARTPAPVCAVVTAPLKGLTGRGATMEQIASALSGIADRGVRDHTGLTGTFDLDFAWVAPQTPLAQSADPNTPSLSTALQEQLGLKLEPMKESMDVLVIDHIEHPTEN